MQRYELDVWCFFYQLKKIYSILAYRFRKILSPIEPTFNIRNDIDCQRNKN
jgi:hypothetical protein